MQTGLFKIILCCTAVAVSGSADASDLVPPVSERAIERFFFALPGSWDGHAIETPVGPLDYDMYFRSCDRDVTAGVAELSVSNHYWRFWRKDSQLRLAFLSTFRGNEVPTQLLVTSPTMIRSGFTHLTCLC
jgi:hypothetical protein